MKAERLAEAELIRARVTKKASAAAPSPTVRLSRSPPKPSATRKSCAVRAKRNATVFRRCLQQESELLRVLPLDGGLHHGACRRRTRRWCCRRTRSSSATSTAHPANRAAFLRQRSICRRCLPHQRTDRRFLRVENIGGWHLAGPFYFKGSWHRPCASSRPHADCTGFREKVISPSIIPPYARGQSALLT
jgi:hypothetical protein